MKIRRQLSCNYHSYKETKQGSKKWLKAREVSEPSYPLGSYQLSRMNTLKNKSFMKLWKVLQILVEIMEQGRNM